MRRGGAGPCDDVARGTGSGISVALGWFSVAGNVGMCISGVKRLDL